MVVIVRIMEMMDELNVGVVVGDEGVLMVSY